MTDPSARLPLFPPPDARDRLPLWVIALLAVFLVLRVLDLHGALSGGHTARVSSMAGQTDEQTMGGLINSNMQAKTAYLQSYTQPGSAGPDPAALRGALKTAESLQKASQNAPSAARRLIVIRGLLHLPLLGPGKNGLDPAQAFTPQSPRRAACRRSQDVPGRGPHLGRCRPWPAFVARTDRFRGGQSAENPQHPLVAGTVADGAISVSGESAPGPALF